MRFPAVNRADVLSPTAVTFLAARCADQQGLVLRGHEIWLWRVRGMLYWDCKGWSGIRLWYQAGVWAAANGGAAG